MSLTDTHPRARAILTSRFRAVGQERCLQMALQMSDEFREVAIAGVRSRNPTASDTDIQREVARLYLGRELADRILGPVDQ